MSTKFKYPSLCFLLLFGAQSICASNGVETDSTKNKYPINDPRNPNCPCHQYQADADKEYARLLQKSAHTGKLDAKGDAFGTQKKVKKVRTGRWTWAGERGNKKRAPKKKCFRDRLSRCFHF